MIEMKPRWYETRAALRAISNILAFSEKSKARQLQKKNKTSVCCRCELIVHELMTESLSLWDVVWWETNKNTSFLFTKTFQTSKSLLFLKTSKQQNCPHFFKIILSWCRKLTHVVCALALMVQFHKQSCLVEVNYLLLVNECAWVVLHVVVVLLELYPKAKTELIVEISRMEKNQINVVLSNLCWNVRWLYLILKTS